MEEKNTLKSGTQGTCMAVGETQLAGTCNQCGACCCSDAVLIEEKDISHWFELHGYDYPVGSEQLTTVMVKKLGPDSVKIVFFDKCRHLVNTETGGRCGIHGLGLRPDKCRNWPTTQRQVEMLPGCSFNENYWGDRK